MISLIAAAAAAAGRGNGGRATLEIALAPARTRFPPQSIFYFGLRGWTPRRVIRDHHRRRSSASLVEGRRAMPGWRHPQPSFNPSFLRCSSPSLAIKEDQVRLVEGGGRRGAEGRREQRGGGDGWVVRRWRWERITRSFDQVEPSQSLAPLARTKE